MTHHSADLLVSELRNYAGGATGRMTTYEVERALRDPRVAKAAYAHMLECGALPAPAHAPSETSRKARPTPTTMNEARAKVLHQIGRTGGCTDEDGHEGIGMNPNTWRPRRVELVRMGLVRDSSQTWVTFDGRDAVVWELTPAGLGVYNETVGIEPQEARR
jgi:hypothetical protein